MRATDDVVALILVCYTGMITLCVGGLCCYHSSLAVSGSTTNEEIRGKYARGGNPYDEGCRKNLSSFFNGGTSRLVVDSYDLEQFNKVEPYVYMIKSRLPASYNKTKAS